MDQDESIDGLFQRWKTRCSNTMPMSLSVQYVDVFGLSDLDERALSNVPALYKGKITIFGHLLFANLFFYLISSRRILLFNWFINMKWTNLKQKLFFSIVTLQLCNSLFCKNFRRKNSSNKLQSLHNSAFSRCVICETLNCYVFNGYEATVKV